MGCALRREEFQNYSYADYAQWEGRWELMDGIPFAMAPSPSLQHQSVSGRIAALLYEALAHCPNCAPLFHFDWKVSENTVLCPDNMVICHEPDNDNYLTRAPALIFEILSPSTARRDRGAKFRTYESEGVPWYVLVDPVTQRAEIWRLESGRYVKQADLSEGIHEFDLGPCRFPLNVSRLWSPKAAKSTER